MSRWHKRRTDTAVCHLRARFLAQMLSSAQALSVQQQNSTDEDMLEFNNTLRTAIFDAYSGIFNGLSKEKVAALLPGSAQASPPGPWRVSPCF